LVLAEVPVSLPQSAISAGFVITLDPEPAPGQAIRGRKNPRRSSRPAFFDLVGGVTSRTARRCVGIDFDCETAQWPAHFGSDSIHCRLGGFSAVWVLTRSAGPAAFTFCIQNQRIKVEAQPPSAAAGRLSAPAGFSVVSVRCGQKPVLPAGHFDQQVGATPRTINNSRTRS